MKSNGCNLFKVNATRWLGSPRTCQDMRTHEHTLFRVACDSTPGTCWKKKTKTKESKKKRDKKQPHQHNRMC